MFSNRLPRARPRRPPAAPPRAPAAAPRPSLAPSPAAPQLARPAPAPVGIPHLPIRLPTPPAAAAGSPAADDGKILGATPDTWKKIGALGFMFFCILFNYTILRDTKVRGGGETEVPQAQHARRLGIGCGRGRAPGAVLGV